MKRILVFSLAYYPKLVGGAEIAIKEITDRISVTDVEFHMVTLRFDSHLPKTEQIGNVLVHRIGFSRPGTTIGDLKKFPLFLNKYWFQFVSPLIASHLHHKYRFDGIWSMMAHSCGIPSGLFKLLHPKVTYVQTLQEGDPPEQIERLARPAWPLFRRAFTTPTVIQTISNFLANWAHRMGAMCPIEVIPNGVDVELFTQHASDDVLRSVREKLSKKEGDILLITTSRLVHKNGLDDVIRALSKLPTHVKFVVLGIGPEEKKLRTLAEECGVVERIIWCGQVSHEDMPAYLQSSDIFIRPSRSEGMGNSFIEAMASGLPVIATHEGGIPDFLFDAKKNPDKPTTGWVVSTNSPEDIVTVVQEILANPIRVAEVVKNARELAITTYDWNLIARAMQERVFSFVSHRSKV